VHGARALGLSDEIGTVEAGKKADLTVVDLTAPHLLPAGPDPHATIVYCARASDVTDVLVDGRLVVRGRRVRTMDARKLAAAAPLEARRLRARVRSASSHEVRERTGEHRQLGGLDLPQSAASRAVTRSGRQTRTPRWCKLIWP